MKNSLHILPFIGIAGVGTGACTTEVGLNSNDGSSTDKTHEADDQYQAHLSNNHEDEAINDDGSCGEGLLDGVISYDEVKPTVFPLDVSHVSKKAIFHEVFAGYRDKLHAVFAVSLADGSAQFNHVEIDKEVDRLDFPDASISFENGDFSVKVDLGSNMSIDQSSGMMIITDSNCESLYGYATYGFEGERGDWSSALTSYLDANGDLIDL